MAEIIGMVLRREEYEVEIFNAAADVLEALETRPFDLLLTDLKMQGLGGMDLLRQLKEEYADIEVIMMTAFSTIEDAVEAMRLGAVDFVPKPFTPDELTAVVSKALEKKRVLFETQHLESAYQDATKAISSSLNLNVSWI